MGVLSNRLQAVKQSKSNVMWSLAGSAWQESAIARIDYKGSPAHMSIGKLVSWINNNVITVQEAEAQFVTLLGKGN
jgi:hypothetical protein